jgi:hypothetical protein
MTQNRSSAVMQQRGLTKASLDDFPTPPWATRALCEWLGQRELGLARKTVREPAANRGHMVRPLAEYFGQVIGSDIHDYGAGFPVRDYAMPLDTEWEHTNWTITNPPFTLAESFIEKALRLSDGVAVILRSAFLESVGRYDRLFRLNPPTDVLQFVERVPMVKGKLDAEASSATSYVWLVWRPRGRPTQLHWIPPCRKRLERREDYWLILEAAAA